MQRLPRLHQPPGSHGLKTHHQLLHNADGLNDVVVKDSEPAKGGTLAEGKHSWGLWHQIATLPRESHVGERLLVLRMRVR